MIARVTGSLLTSAPFDSGWVSAWGALVDEEGRGKREEGSVRPLGPALLYSSLFPLPASLFSYDPIYQGAQKHDDAYDPVGGEERRVES